MMLLKSNSTSCFLKEANKMKLKIVQQFALIGLISGLLACDAGAMGSADGSSAGPAPIVDASPDWSTARLGMEQMQEATVKIYAVDAGGMAMWTGSGTVVSPDGLIVTNAHVSGGSGPSSLNLAAFYNSPEIAFSEPPAALVIAMLESVDSPPVEKYYAEILARDGALDLAILRIVSDLDGNPPPGDMVFLPIGDSDALILGEELRILGYPGAGGETITFTRGDVAGFESQERVGNRAWIKTDATASPGNSGGLGADEAGNLIGVPSYVQQAVGGAINRLRSVKLAIPMIEAAISGREYISPYEVVGNGSEKLQFVTWTDSLTEDGCAARRISSYPSNSIGMAGTFSYSGMMEGQPILVAWAYNGDLVAVSVESWRGGNSGECYPVFYPNYSGEALPDGNYNLQVIAGPKLETVIANEVVGVGRVAASNRKPSLGQTPSGSGTVEMIGTIADSGSGRPVEDATIFILLPGTDIQIWAENPVRSDIYAMAQSDKQGKYRLPDRLELHTTYPVVIAAEEFSLVTGEIELDEQVSNPFVQDIMLVR